MAESQPLIRTPDQRLRVFVSSTLQELAPERRAVRGSVERLRLTPVMFELGARPHPPRDLYRAYLRQSHVFVGCYWERYGWVAPGESVSGLEDEYDLSAGMPRLIYVKTSTRREERLEGLLDRIRDDDTASYKEFGDAAELARLLEDDLAVLLSERFELAANPSPPHGEPGATSGPPLMAAPLTRLVGRERQVQELDSMLAADDVRLVTLVGPGGIGKTRLAMEVGARAAPAFADGVWFVDLATVHDPALVPATIARTIGVRDAGDEPLPAKLRTALAGRRALLVLDNFEQVLPAAPELVALLAAAPALKVMVTSRGLLRVGGERGFEVGPLAVPRRGGTHDILPAARASSAVELFVERARAVRPDFELVEGNAGPITDICRALDGVPLALELAAARLRTLTPSTLLARLDRALPLLSGGAQDLPKRQRTLRATLDWSYDLLGGQERVLFADLGIFAGEFTLDAAEEVGGRPGRPVLDLLESLVDFSLVHQRDRDGTPWFTMRAVVREYARERLEASPDPASVRARHAAHHVALAAAAAPHLYGLEQVAVTARLARVHDDLRAAVGHLLEHGENARAVRLVWDLFLYWWVDGHLDEARRWMEDAQAGGPLPDLQRACALVLSRLVAFMQVPESGGRDVEDAIAIFRRHGDTAGEALAVSLVRLSEPDADLRETQATLDEAAHRARRAGDAWGETMALFTSGRLALMRGDTARARESFLRARTVAEIAGDAFTSIVALNNLGWASLEDGDLAAARSEFEEALTSAESLGHDEGVAYGLEGLGAVAALTDDAGRAGLLLGAGASRRARSGLRSFSLPPTIGDRARAVDPAGFDAAYERGRALSDSVAAAVALTPGPDDRAVRTGGGAAGASSGRPGGLRTDG